jgi:hypothetical protein
MRILTIIFTLALVLGIRSVVAEAWVRGSAVVIEATGGVEVRVPAEGEVYDSFEKPRYLSGIFSSYAQSDGSALFHTSNGMTLAFRGEGHFSVERFEGLFDIDSGVEQDELAETRSRMILNLRRGELLIDSRSLTADSKFVIETPFGRISSVKAVLLVRIEFDYRSGIYDFTISCTEGTVRLSDKRKQSYSIYAGQRIAGAGSYSAPAIEVGDQTDQIREKFDLFFEALERLNLDKVDQAELRAHMEALPDLEDTTNTAYRLLHDRPKEEGKRPRVIEFAPQAEYVTPFRGEVKPPSDFQADIF